MNPTKTSAKTRTSGDPFAVLVNTNARRVDPGVVTRISELVDPEHVFVTDSLGEAERCARTLVDRGYPTVFTGGGDGTVHHFLNAADPQRTPRLGVLRLGTGNGLASVVSSGDPMSDLQSYTINPYADAHHLRLCRAEGQRFAFGGMGLDAAILNDSLRLQRLGRPFRSFGGYFMAAFGMTIPKLAARWLRRKKTFVKVTNIGATAHRVELDGQGARLSSPIGPGEVLYEGPIKGAMFGTCPFYGYRLKALPFAGVEPNRFHLRLSNVGAPRLIVGMRGMWRGTLQSKQLHDFHVDRVKIELSEPMPYQLAGEPQGFREELEVGLDGGHVDLVRFI